MTNDKVWLEIDLENVIPTPLRPNLTCVEIDKHNYDKWTEQINYLIELFNSEHTWDEMWNMESAKTRFDSNISMFILIDDEIPIGYVWIDTEYLYNLFVSKNRKNGDSKSFVSTVLSRLDYEKLYCYCDGENIKAQKLFKNIGFKPTNKLFTNVMNRFIETTKS